MRGPFSCIFLHITAYFAIFCIYFGDRVWRVCLPRHISHTLSHCLQPAAGQPELVQLQENLRQMCTHYNAKIDGCDIAALTDLFQWMQRPETQAEGVDLFGTCLGTVGKAPALMSSDDVQKLKSTRDHMQETCNLLEEELKNGPSAQHEWQLREMKKKVVKLDEVLGKMNP